MKETLFLISEAARESRTTPAWWSQLCSTGRISPVAYTAEGRPLLSEATVRSVIEEKRRHTEARTRRLAVSAE